MSPFVLNERTPWCAERRAASYASVATSANIIFGILKRGASIAGSISEGTTRSTAMRLGSGNAASPLPKRRKTKKTPRVELAGLLLPKRRSAEHGARPIAKNFGDGSARATAAIALWRGYAAAADICLATKRLQKKRVADMAEN